MVNVGYMDSLYGISMLDIVVWVDVIFGIVYTDGVELNWGDKEAWAISVILTDTTVLVKCVVGDIKYLVAWVIFDESIVVSGEMLDVIFSPGEKELNFVLGSVVIAVGSVVFTLGVCITGPIEDGMTSVVIEREEIGIDSLVDMKLDFAVGIVVL